MAYMNGKLIREFHEAKWDEPIIYELSVPGERGIVPPKAHADIIAEVGNNLGIPEGLKRKTSPDLPELNQYKVNRHFMRLTQEILGVDVTADMCEGTCTMKYSPKIQEHTANSNPKITEVHPLQDPETMQGTLEVYYEVERYLKSISGMDAFSFQPGGGAHAVFSNASVVRRYFEDKGEDRDEIITTIFSHPADAGGPATAGFKVIDLMQDPDKGYPTLEAFKAALSEKTAAIFITNPEDTGIFNPDIDKYVEAAHAVGALAVYDQANVNGLMGITRAKEAGFDLIHYNLHKTFSSPHGGMGPGCGAMGCKEFLKDYLPLPRVTKSEGKFDLDWKGNGHSVGQVAQFMGCSQAVLRAYMWLRALGPDGVKEAAMCAVLNNQYLMSKLAQVKGVSIYYAEGLRRIEQCRYSWEQLKADTGIGTEEVNLRLVDYGFQHYWLSHHPYIVPEPFTIEPTDSFSKADIDEFVAILEQISKECYETPELVKTAPHNAPIHGIKNYHEDDPEKACYTWKQYKKAHNME